MVEPDAEMQNWTHSAIAKIRQDQTHVGALPGGFSRGSDRPIAPMESVR